MIRLTNRLFGTHPVVAHAPGALSPSFLRLAAAVLASPPPPTRPTDPLTILTWNTGPRLEKPCGVMEKSLAKLDSEPRVLGQRRAKWQNIDKLRLTAAALADVSTPYVMGADSCDVVFLDSPSIVLERYLAHFTADLVFNATGPRCWPELPTFVTYESSRPLAAVAQGRHWLNSGVWVARTAFAREYFAALAELPPVAGYESSDQAVIKREWPRWYPRVQLDYCCLLFQWFNESRANLDVERPLDARQRQLLELFRPLGERLVGAEVGVWDGLTSEALLRGLPGLDLWMVDSWQPYTGQCSLDRQPAAAFEQALQTAEWWTEFAGTRRHILRAPSLAAAQHFADESLDFVFLDANHVYESIRDDICTWWPKIRAGGLLTGHDYGVYGDAPGGGWGVSRAVDEFAANLRRTASVGADGVWWVPK